MVVKASPSGLCNNQYVGVMLEVGNKPRAFVVLSGGVRRGMGDLLWPPQTCFFWEGGAVGVDTSPDSVLGVAPLGV